MALKFGVEIKNETLLFKNNEIYVTNKRYAINKNTSREKNPSACFVLYIILLLFLHLTIFY